jgi:RHS repeat-associated protein
LKADRLKDALGSTVALVDSSGNMQASYTYDPYGGTSVTGTGDGNEFQYTGRENEGNGLYFYRARYYSPLLGRFVSEDPLGFAGGDVNAYRYVLDTPTILNDPSGRHWRDWVPVICNADSFRFYGGGVEKGRLEGGVYRLDDVHYANGPNGWRVADYESGVLLELADTKSGLGGGMVAPLNGRKGKEYLAFAPIPGTHVETHGHTGPFERELWGGLGLVVGWVPGEGLSTGFYGGAGAGIGLNEKWGMGGGGGGGWSVTWSSLSTCNAQMAQ